MVYEVVMPRLGWNMESGALSSWRAQDGDFIQVGQILLEIESDKAIQEVEALESGILRIPPNSPPPGEEVPVGTLLAYLLQPGETLPDSASDKTGQTEGGLMAPEPTAPVTPSPVSGQTGGPAERPGRKAISPRAARLASELGVDWSGLQGSGRSGRIVERDIRQAATSRQTESRLAGQPPAASPPEIQASPLARDLAQAVGLDLAVLAARLPGKRIERADVEAAIRTVLQAAQSATGPTPLSTPAPESTVEASFSPSRQPVSALRKRIAGRLAASTHTAAAVTLTTEADATELIRLRRQLKDDGAGLVPTYTDALICLVARALMEHPQLNAHFEGEAIVQPGTVNIGLGVDTPRGLVVPVVRAAHTKSLIQVAQETTALIEQARRGQLRPEEMRGGTFTITNLGMFEIDAFTPIINLPECAVLGVGRVVPRPVVLEADAEQVTIRHMLSLSLTFDHRLVDGAPAARFLQRIKHLVEKPYLWLGNR